MQVKPFHIESPTIKSNPLSDKLKTNIYLKLDIVQPSGSFKIRGIGNVCQKAVIERGCTHLVASSGGNAGLSVAYSARKLGVPSTVVIPKTTPAFMRDKIKSEGASVIVHGENWAEANEKAKEICAQTAGSELIHPFDHPDIWDGHTSIVQELYHQLPKKPDAIICVVGGGGLLCGISKGLQRVGWNDVPILACETEGSTKFKESLETGHVVHRSKINTIAKALGVSYVTNEVLNLNHVGGIHPIVVTDKDTVKAIVNFSRDHNILLEPSCGAGVSLLYCEELKCHIQKYLGEDKLITMIICGGNMVNLSLIKQWEDTLLTA
jgi:L-serine/L-threonine ammonia-lyase